MMMGSLGVSAQTVDTISNQLISQTSYDFYFLEAMVQRQKGNNDAAFDLLRHCTQLKPEAAEAWYYLSQYYQILKNDSLAQQCLLQAAELEPDNATYQERPARNAF